MKKDSILRQPDGTRCLAWLLLLLFSTSILLPGNTYAGGPGQPEVSGFTPIGVSEMVDPFTGDLTYNIPLMDVEGYPINIAYQSGITMEQESSWVGLGWNLNAGSVVRNMRGIPDDFKSDTILRETHMRPNRTYSINGKLGLEIFGKSNKSTGDSSETVSPPSLSVSLGFGYNNYNGYSTQFSISPSFSLLDGTNHGLVAGFSLSGSSENGVSFAPSASFERALKSKDIFDRTLSGTIGSTFNSRAGLSYISYEAGIKRASVNANTSKRQDFVSNTLRNGIGGSYDLGLATYSPSAGHAMRNVSITGKWKTGFTLFGSDASGDIGFTYSSQWIAKADEKLKSPAYGYFNLGSGQQNEKAILDFNRDNDGSFTKYTPFIASAHLTNDLFSIQAQGISGSYRGFRNEVGYVFDPQVKTISSSGSVGVETGVGNTAKVGIDLAYNHTSAKTGGWTTGNNHPREHFEFSDAQGSPVYENYAMQEANERSVNTDPLFSTDLAGSNAVFFPLSGLNISPKLDYSLKGKSITEISSPNNARSSRHKRNQVMQFLSHEDLGKGFGISARHPNIYSEAQPHHIGEIIQTGTDGRRYVFGIAAYNHFQEEVTFATGKQLNGGAGLAPADYYNGLISYDNSLAGDIASANNKFGIDNYYSSTRTPAYAHSFLLTAVLSDDYIDSDNTKGPSTDDQGSYVKFGYKKVESYRWRTPVNYKEAYRNEGLKTDALDDKASFIYGEKDLWYLDTIQTKNYIVLFKTEDRADAFSVNNRDGGMSAGNSKMKLLRKISLYSKADFNANGANAVPIQEVHFVYSYELCPGYAGNPRLYTVPSPDATGTGKLTLKQIYFTYQGSRKMKYSPYVFSYGSPSDNPSYNMKATDRWGNYKPTSSASSENPFSDPLNNSDFPYTDQDRSNTDRWASAWSLRGIKLPSGGSIQIEYESDDYAYVQNRRAMRMFPIASVEGGDEDMNNVELLSVSNRDNTNRKIYFRMIEGQQQIDKYITKGAYMYFRCLTSFTEGTQGDPRKYEYVSGYGKISSTDTFTDEDGVLYGEIQLESEKLMDNGSDIYSPIAKAGIQFGRMHLSRYISDVPGVNSPSDSEQGFLDFAGSVVDALGSLGELFTGPNMPIYNKERGTQILTQKSWIRLYDPTECKLGGNSRVKKILMKDNWNAMSGMSDFDYGQEFIYKTALGASSGLATYEPQAGGDENTCRQPVLYQNKLRLSPDEHLYIDNPLMESLFPSPTVGYSRVEIRDLKRTNVVRTATGKVVKEFYTAKDYPVITEATEIKPKVANSFLPVLPKYQYLTVSQGFTIELNDMHGKPRSESVYAENKPAPISTVEYTYKNQPAIVEGMPASKLVNDALVIYPNGSTGTAELGVKYEALADFRQSSTKSHGGAVEGNLNFFFLGPLPMLIPTAWPSVDISSNQFRSAGFTKVINRFAILEKTKANQDGSIVETRNVAYDSETGEVLLTQTTTNFNDQVYSMNYPAYWAYSPLGAAYKNIGLSIASQFNTAGYTVTANAPQQFAKGDELMIKYTSGSTTKGWVSDVFSHGIQAIDKAGNPVAAGPAQITVIRSGYKNKQSVSMASLTSLDNPLASLTTNNYSKVLNAGAVEFSQDWKTYCNCYSGQTKTTNPFRLGTEGNWRPVRSYTYLSGRTQSSFNNNTNIRRDGVFTAYTPYYKNQGGKWTENGLNWTYVSEVTEFSPNGMALETRDALNRYSATTFGFNNTLTTAVGANTRLTQLAFASFEDNSYSNCADVHFKIPGTVSSSDAHTGRKSLAVTAGTPAVFTTSLSTCKTITCEDLDLTWQSSDPDLDIHIYQITNGTGPYQLEYDVLSGTPEASISGNTLRLKRGTGYYEIRITITDSKGCKLIKTFYTVS